MLLLSFWPHILALLSTINQVTPSHGCSVVKIWLRPAGLSGTTSSLMQFVFETKRNHPATIFSEYLQPVQGNYSMVKIISLSSAYIACRRHPYIKSIPTLSFFVNYQSVYQYVIRFVHCKQHGLCQGFSWCVVYSISGVL